ncbi:hypothetical protein FA95DRAFT_1564348 [Auriscalpium vulgare]|uniref:Uncharacterized protein n=1 Tax=Auriscalpium vulgare TaxID=40419 RepID=A0ACB8RFL8_9AGAM|nr:hypothetical protein FA95DRAFT_1564348 [Auriscalpium vulgare]
MQIEGSLKLKEIGEGGTNTYVLCNEIVHLWRKGVDAGPCPSSLAFSVPLPTSFSDEKGSYPLPPTYEAHLTGLPGFTANVDYAVTAVASKTKNIVLSTISSMSVSTPFIYYPRTRPGSPIPPALLSMSSAPGLRETAEWKPHTGTIVARPPGVNAADVTVRFYLPKSQVFCLTRAIPFHISFTGSAVALATLLPFMPSRNGQALSKSCASIRVLRQSSVDVRNDYQPVGTNTELWRVFNIGEGSIHRTGDGRDWLTFSGEILVNPDVNVGGFKAGGLWVKDCIVFSMTPPDSLKGPIGDLRLVVPVRLVTDPWTSAAYVPEVSPAHSEDAIDELAYSPI